MSSMSGQAVLLSESKNQLLQQLLSRTGSTGYSIPKVPAGQRIPLSFSQQRLWFLDKFLEDKSVYNIPLFMRLHGSLDKEVLFKSIVHMLRKHHILRASIADHGEAAELQIGESLNGWIETIPYIAEKDGERESFVHRMAEQWLSHEFSLQQGPLFKIALLELSDTEFVLLICLHHMIFDGWSQQIWIREWTQHYNQLVTGTAQIGEESLRIQYADYACWQHRQLESGQWDHQLSYWSKQLSGALPVLELPTDYLPPAIQTFRGRQHVLDLSAEHSRQVNAFCLHHGVTPHMFFLAAYKALLAIYSAQEDILVGIPVAGRHHGELENIIGMFVNTLVIRSLVDPAYSFADHVQNIKKLCLQAYEHQDIPFEKLVEQLAPDRSTSGSPIFRTLFSMQNYSSDDNVDLHGLQSEWLEVENHTAKYDLSLFMSEQTDRFTAEWQYNTELFCADTIARMGRHFEQLVAQVLNDPHITLGEINVLTPDETLMFSEVNRTQSDIHSGSVQELFRRQAVLYPDWPAVHEENRILSYQELENLSDREALRLLQHGVQAGQRVAVCLERSASFVVAVLAVLKAGAVYIPLDPSLPESRLAYILEDVQPQAIFAERKAVSFLHKYTDQLLIMDIDNPAGNQAAVGADESDRSGLDSIPLPIGSANDLAYIIYTSGSTGTPKGVCIRHEGIIRLVQNTNYVDIQPGHQVAQIANASFDAITFELWGALLNGACLHIMPQDTVLSPPAFSAWIKERSISFMFVTVTLFNQIVQQVPSAFEKLDTLLVGGEACHPKWMNEVIRHGKPLHLLNGYGPTESTTFALTYELNDLVPDTQYSIPIGRPISNSSVYVLDPYGRQVPVNVPGELYIGGAGLASGYWQRDELTASRFVRSPHLDEEVLYRTGDRVKWLPDGTISYLERLDHQVKLRGYRIELGEIEETVRRHSGIREAVVRLRYSADQQPFLAAYFTAGEPVVLMELNAYLKSVLPDYMIPSALLRVDSFHMTTNGKINTHLLPDIPHGYFESAEYAAPQSEMEEVVAEIWQDVLGISRISMHDSFFSIGGHSLLAIQVIAALEQILEQSLSIRLLFEHSTVRELAAALDALWSEQ
ncbi:non-ribosomal peptide synthetase [Paenibacillus wulumuqiensis]|uniref:non-ribosomal peptide synthetase n=1 Tax=Paenibacillus wulumuqiensis TaxID=1567107 RepID=UPI00061938A3|nr:non-ribosomal peptide synthetase [Paenibacillus wulumuqiensis]